MLLPSATVESRVERAPSPVHWFFLFLLVREKKERNDKSVTLTILVRIFFRSRRRLRGSHSPVNCRRQAVQREAPGMQQSPVAVLVELEEI